jgi:hypothetical protein
MLFLRFDVPALPSILLAYSAELLARAEAADQADVADGMSIPEELAVRWLAVFRRNRRIGESSPLTAFQTEGGNQRQAKAVSGPSGAMALDPQRSICADAAIRLAVSRAVRAQRLARS